MTNFDKLYKLATLFSFAISVDEIKSKPKGQVSTQEEWENIINQLSFVENNPNNQLTIQYALEISKGKETLNSAIEKIKKLTEKKSVSIQDQLKQKYKSDVIEIEKSLNNHGKKYLTIACKWILEDKNNLTDVCQTLNIFDSVSNNLSHKSPDKYNSYEELHLEISNIPDKEIVDLNVDLPFLGSAGSYKIYRIENQSQGMKIGQDIENAIGWKNIQKKVGGSGRWCITWTQNNYYNTYSAQNQYFYFVDDISQDWNEDYDKLKSCIVHYVKDFEGNIKEKYVTTLANGEPENISNYSELSAVDNIITKDVEKQPERVLSKLIRGAADQKEFNTFVVNYHMNPNPEVIESEKDGLRNFLDNVNSKYFNKSLYNIVKNRKTEEYKVFLTAFIKKTNDYELQSDLAVKEFKETGDRSLLHYIKDPAIRSDLVLNAFKETKDSDLLHYIKDPAIRSDLAVNAFKETKDSDLLHYIKDPAIRSDLAVNAFKETKDSSLLHYIKDPAIRSDLAVNAFKETGNNIFLGYIDDPMQSDLAINAFKETGNDRLLGYIDNPMRSNLAANEFIKTKDYTLFGYINIDFLSLDDKYRLVYIVKDFKILELFSSFLSNGVGYDYVMNILDYDDDQGLKLLTFIPSFKTGDILTVEEYIIPYCINNNIRSVEELCTKLTSKFNFKFELNLPKYSITKINNAIALKSKLASFRVYSQIIKISKMVKQYHTAICHS